MDNPDNRVLLAFFFIFSAFCVVVPFRRAHNQGRELAGATDLNPESNESKG